MRRLGILLLTAAPVLGLAHPAHASDGPAAFRPTGEIPLSRSRIVGFNDVTGDGKDDVVLVDAVTLDLWVLLGSDNGLTSAGIVGRSVMPAPTLVSGDVDGDGFRDAVLTEAGYPDSLVLLGGVTPGTFTPTGAGYPGTTVYPAPSTDAGVVDVAVDFDRDGVTDTIADGLIHFGGRSDTQPLPLPEGLPPTADPRYTVADVDGDGLADLAATYDVGPGQPRLQVYLNVVPTPPVLVPEVPVAVALPLSAVAVVGGVAGASVLRRRRTARLA